jgi:hypothetical protein
VNDSVPAPSLDDLGTKHEELVTLGFHPREITLKKLLIATTALTLMCGAALAQSSTGPAAQGYNVNKPGTAGSAMKPDASQQGAPTGAAVNSKGTSTEPGKVKDGASR